MYHYRMYHRRPVFQHHMSDGTITASDMHDCCVVTANSFDKKQTGISVGVDCDSVTPKTIPLIAITANTETPIITFRFL